jgi:hypothetical protein
MEDRITWKHEPVLYGWKEGAAHNWYSDRKKQTTIIEFNKPLRSEDHPRSQWTCLPI